MKKAKTAKKKSGLHVRPVSLACMGDALLVVGGYYLANRAVGWGLKPASRPIGFRTVIRMIIEDLEAMASGGPNTPRSAGYRAASRDCAHLLRSLLWEPPQTK